MMKLMLNIMFLSMVGAQNDFNTKYLDFCLNNQHNSQTVINFRFCNDPMGAAMFAGWNSGTSFLQGLRATVGAMGGWVHLDGGRGSVWRNMKITLPRGAGAHAIVSLFEVWAVAQRLELPALLGPRPPLLPGQPVPDFNFQYGPFLLTFNHAAMGSFNLAQAMQAPLNPFQLAMMGGVAHHAAPVLQQPDVLQPPIVAEPSHVAVPSPAVVAPAPMAAPLPAPLPMPSVAAPLPAPLPMASVAGSSSDALPVASTQHDAASASTQPDAQHDAQHDAHDDDDVAVHPKNHGKRKMPVAGSPDAKARFQKKKRCSLGSDRTAYNDEENFFIL